MIRFVFRAAAAAAVAMCLLVAAPAASKPTSKKEASKKVDKKADAKKADRKADRAASKKADKKAAKAERASRDKKPDKKADKKADKRADTKASSKPEVAASQKRSKSGDRDDRDAPKRAPVDDRAAAAGSSGRVEPSVVAYGSSAGESDLEDEEPAGPRPVNRLVSSIPTARVLEIQAALQKAGVYAGPATGVWDQPTFDAMSAFQRRNNFGATGMPTAEALKALGVRKNSGIGIQSPSTVLERTALDGAGRQPEPSSPTMSGPRQR